MFPRSPIAVFTAASFACALTVSCKRHDRTPNNAPRPATSSSVADTARGILRRVGPEPVSQLMLAPLPASKTGTTFALRSDSLTTLAAAEGVEIVVRGERLTERAMDVAPGGAQVFRVREFQVRAVDGMEARDGTLRLVNGAYLLELRDGTRQPIIDCPVALRSAVGARIYLVGPATHAPQAFGILRR